MSEQFQEIGFGSFESPPDYRDVALADVIEPIALPKKARVEIDNLPVEHQRKIGSCVGHAAQKYKQKLDEVDEGTIVPLSPRFVYAICKALDGVPGEGTYPRLSMKVLKDYGCATTATVPNDSTLDHETYVYNRNIENIPKEAFKEAERYKISGYASVPITADGIKRAIFQASGASMLNKIGSEWWTDVNGNTTWDGAKILPLRRPTSIVSGHQIYYYAYEDAEHDGKEDTKFYFFNSWSEDWGDQGKGWFWWSEIKDYVIEGYTAVDLPKPISDTIHDMPKPEAFSYTFKNQLKYGMKNAEVKVLQRALQIDGVFPKDQQCTYYYGPITARAVLLFQRKYAVASPWETLMLGGRKVGPKTLAKLNQLFSK